jgi:hypothetical protein
LQFITSINFDLTGLKVKTIKHLSFLLIELPQDLLLSGVREA